MYARSSGVDTRVAVAPVAAVFQDITSTATTISVVCVSTIANATNPLLLQQSTQWARKSRIVTVMNPFLI
jgi:hypothetical protein